MNKQLQSTVSAILVAGKGILAADESFPTIEKRFKALQIPSTLETRQEYREMLFHSPGLSEFISGVILFDETLRQPSTTGGTVPEMLARQGIVPGIKVDLGTVALPNFKGEKFTQGLYQLGERLAEYRKLGARFTKWRAVLKIGTDMPSDAALRTNATMLAIFAALSQEAELVPIVEPEVLMDGSHDLAASEEATSRTLRTVFETLANHRVVLESMLLKTGMVLPGKESSNQSNVSEIAEATMRCLLRSVPAAVPGIVFLSGGQEDVEATERLNAICALPSGPWKISFSFGRALQSPSMKAWAGSKANLKSAQLALHHRARCNSLAVQGRYTSNVENQK